MAKFEGGKVQILLELSVDLAEGLDLARARVRKQAEWGADRRRGPVTGQSRSEFVRDAIRKAVAAVEGGRYRPPGVESRDGETPIVEVQKPGRSA